MFKDKIVILTGSMHGIGQATKEEFLKNGAIVCDIDINEGAYFVGDIANKDTLEKFVDKVIKEHGHIDYIINNAPPKFIGIDNCSYEDFLNAQKVGVIAPFYIAKLCKPYFNKDACIINISSSRDRMSQPQSESYTAAKGGIAALTHSLAVSLAGVCRVNSISPGWIDTQNSTFEPQDISQHPANKVGKPIDIANAILFLCSDKASFITGENICIDGGMTKLMIYHNDHNWSYNK